MFCVLVVEQSSHEEVFVSVFFPFFVPPVSLKFMSCYFCYVRVDSMKGLTSEEGSFFLDNGGKPLTNFYSDLKRLRKK